jgi:hypothetical protein
MDIQKGMRFLVVPEGKFSCDYFYDKYKFPIKIVQEDPV